MAGQVEIYNMALSAATARSSLSSVSDPGREAELCNLWYPHVRDTIFRGAFWNSLKMSSYLSLIAERDYAASWAQGDPLDPWRYAYAIPSNMAAARYLGTFGRFEVGLYLPVGETDPENAQRVLFTNDENALLIYTAQIERTTLWDTALTMAVVYGLAAHITLPLTGKRDILNANVSLANQYLMDARVASANEQERQMETVPEWITARGYFESAPDHRFIYPYGPLLTVSTQVLNA